MARTVVAIPVPEAELVVRPRLVRRAPELVPADPDDVVAHITVLSPFAPAEEVTAGVAAELDAFFADVTPFPFTLTSLHLFPGGTLYLAPAPSAPFRQLTHGLAQRFPEYPPYEGAFDDVVPHLSVPLPDDETPEQVEQALAGRLPIRAMAREAVLYLVEPGACRTLTTFPFGTTAA